MVVKALQKVANVAKAVVGTSNERILREIRPLVDEINAVEPEFQRKSDEELGALTRQFRERLSKAKSYEEKQRMLEQILPQAFANVREAARRTLITPAADSPYPMMRPFDVQIIGGVALHRGMIAEMVTGEGKTLVATFAAYLNALPGDGVHIVTVNDYLAKRDCEWMGQVYNLLGLTAGYIQALQDYEEKKAAYRCDVTFGTNNEFGFDYLRDNMRYSPETQVQLVRGLNYAIVDEVDNILIDEARTPLILTGMVMQQSDKYYMANNIARALKAGRDYELKIKEESVHLTDEGISRAERMLGVQSLYNEDTMEWPHFIETAVRVHEFFERDTDYIVKDGEVVIVDEFTGRLMEGRVWGGGVHQAVTVKEGLKLRE
ncbi:MAG: preprotein translocase subunit SecA, partial [Planctomycetota bacterium]